MSQPAASSSPRSSPPPGVAAEAGVTLEGAAAVHDVRYKSGERVVYAYLVLPRQLPARAGVLFFHWLSSQGGNRGEFRSEAVEMAGHGIASLLVQGDFPWATQPSGVDHDMQAIRAELAGVEAGVAVLLEQPGVDVAHLAFVGHDYGAMYGALVVAQDTRFKGAVLMAADARWVDWFSQYWTFLKTPAERDAYAKAMQPLDPVAVLATVRSRVLLQFGRTDEYIPVGRAETVAASVPAQLREMRWYDSDHGLNDVARSDRDAWLQSLLGV